MKLTYPQTKTVAQIDDYHGTRVEDPYRWLEASASTPEVRGWIEAQNSLSESYLKTIPEREGIKTRLTELWDFPKTGAPFAKGGRYFQFRNSGLQNQDVLYVMETPKDEGRILLDPNTLSEDGTVSLRNLSVSPDGRYLAYATSQSGSDWQTWHVRVVETGDDLPDVLPWSKFSGATWLPDSQSFFYTRYPQPDEVAAYTDKNEAPELYRHTLGSDSADDPLVYSRPDKPEWMFSPSVSDDERYLILHIGLGTLNKNLLFYRELTSGDFTELIGEFEAEYSFLGNDGSTFYIRTDDSADRSRIIAIDVEQSAKENWREIVPESGDTLEHALMLGDDFICLYLQDASHRLRRFSTEGEARGEIALPTLGSVAGYYAERSDKELFYSFTSFLTPSTPYRFDPQTGSSDVLSETGPDFDTSPYVTRQVFATSKDGTRVPMFLVHKEGLEGPSPTLLYGYGGFNISLTPAFSVSRLVWLERGGILAVANLRGGGEYGTAWHEAGTGAHKQNVFDDFIACAEHLIAEGVTDSKQLAIQGGSNGGLLVGACMTQRPELFGACLPAVGVMDMLRFHRFTIGWAWASDYGSAEVADEFPALYAYSPLHNLKPGCYPPTLVTTGDFDDRVVPAHSFKFAAALQAAQRCDAPTLIRIQTKAGHGQGKPTKFLIEEQTDIWSFLVRVLETP